MFKTKELVNFGCPLESLHSGDDFKKPLACVTSWVKGFLFINFSYTVMFVGWLFAKFKCV